MPLYYVRVRSRDTGAVTAAYTIDAKSPTGAEDAVPGRAGIDPAAVTCHAELWSAVVTRPDYPPPTAL